VIQNNRQIKHTKTCITFRYTSVATYTLISPHSNYGIVPRGYHRNTIITIPKQLCK